MDPRNQQAVNSGIPAVRTPRFECMGSFGHDDAIERFGIKLRATCAVSKCPKWTEMAFASSDDWHESSNAKPMKDADFSSVDGDRVDRYDNEQQTNQSPRNRSHENAPGRQKAHGEDISNRAENQPPRGSRVPEPFALAHEIDVALARENQHEEHQGLKLAQGQMQHVSPEKKRP